MIELAQLKRITEAALLAAGQPLTVAQILALFGEEEMPSHDQIAQALDELRQDSEQRGVELVEVASGFRYQVRHDEHQWVARLWTERQTRYSRALLETLALIAYRQPITRGEIEQIRGVAVSTKSSRRSKSVNGCASSVIATCPANPRSMAPTRIFSTISI